MIEFTLFGIPIRIQPWHWIGLAFISGAFYMSSSDQIPFFLLFIIAGFFTILTHELAHALVGRYYGGGGAAITLILLGGYTQHFNSRFNSKFGKRAMIVSGCAVNLTVLLLCLLVLFLLRGFNINETFLFAKNILISPHVVRGFYEAGILSQEAVLPYFFLGALMWTSFWWGLLNLLPILPLDGGQLLDNMVRSHKTTYYTGFAVSVVLAIIGYQAGYWLLTVFMGFFAYQNFKNAQETR